MAASPEPPLVLIYRRPRVNHLDDVVARDFRLLNPHDSPDPLPIFLSRHASSVRAVVVDVSPVTAEIISLLPSLQIIVCTSVGVDHVDLEECRRRGIAVTNAARAVSEDTADFALGLLISVLRRIPAADSFVRAGRWSQTGAYTLGFKLGGKRVGIVGLGNIGIQVVKRLEPFGCIISYTSRTQKPNIPHRYYPDVLSLAGNNDILILCCSLTDETHHMINAEVLKSLGRDGVLINVGRGGLVNEKELVRFLVQGEIRGAGLDVYENEPNVPEELFSLDNVVLSPHTAFGTPGSIAGATEIALGNLKAFYSNEPLLSPVQLD